MRRLVSPRTLSSFGEELKRRKLARYKQIKQARHRQEQEEIEKAKEREKEIERVREREKEAERIREREERERRAELGQRTEKEKGLGNASSTTNAPPSLAPHPEREQPEKEIDQPDDEPEKEITAEEEQGISFAQALMGEKPKRRKPKHAPPAKSGKGRKHQVLFSTASLGYR